MLEKIASICSGLASEGMWTWTSIWSDGIGSLAGGGCGGAGDWTPLDP
jgi:hypothetical protein